MTTNPAIPDRPEAITPEWLSEVLAESFPGVEVAAVETLAQHSGTTGRVRLGLAYAAGPSGPESVFVKLAPFDESQQRLVAVTDMGRREARFYAGPATELSLRLPRSYHAAHGEEPTEYIMVLEDLEAAGASFSSRLETHAQEHGLAVMELLARLHAHFWDDPRFDDELSWVQPAMRSEFGAMLVDSAREQFADRFPPVFDELCRFFVEHWERIAALWDEGEQTLVHGDTHAGNQFVEGGRVGYYDWAVISRSPGIRDVAIYLGNSCPTDVRRDHEEQWLSAYRQTLLDTGVDAPPLETLWRRYRMGVLYAWVAATTTSAMGSKWQPIEVGMLGMERATASCADLETLEALRESL